MDDDNAEAIAKKARKGSRISAPTIDLTATEIDAGKGEAASTAASASASLDDASEPSGSDTSAAVDAPPEGPLPEVALPEDAPRPEEQAAATGPSAESAAETPPEPSVEPPAEPIAPKFDFYDQPPREAPSRMALGVAALIGGVVGAVLVLAAALSGILPGFHDDSDALRTRLAAVEQDVASSRDGLAQATGRLTVVEAATKDALGTAGNAVNLAEEAKTAAAKTPAVSAVTSTGGATTDLGPLEDRVAKVEALAAQTQSDLAAAKDQIAALAKGGDAATGRTAAYAVALSALDGAITEGRPFQSELAAVTKLGSDPQAMAPLQPFAADGVPTVFNLVRDFDALSPRLVEALTPPPPAPPADAGVFDRLWFSLSHVVSIRREGEAAPDDPVRPVAAVSAALGQGDLAAAAVAFDAMPEAARKLGADWRARAAAQLDTSSLVGKLRGDALAKLGQE